MSANEHESGDKGSLSIPTTPGQRSVPSSTVPPLSSSSTSRESMSLSNDPSSQYPEVAETMWRFLAQTSQNPPPITSPGGIFGGGRPDDVHKGLAPGCFDDREDPLVVRLGAPSDQMLGMMAPAEIPSWENDIALSYLSSPPETEVIQRPEYSNNESMGIHSVFYSGKNGSRTPRGQLGSIASTTSLCERLSCLRHCAKLLGFGSLDAVLSLYYTADLSESPALSEEQRTSRERRLPTLLSEIREHSNTWNRWEQSGFIEEMLRGAQYFYAEEVKQGKADLEEQLMGTLDDPLMIESVPEIAWILRDKYPRLWALITSLIAHTASGEEQAHPHGAFACVMTVCHPMKPLPPAAFAGNVRNSIP
ncbi:hypothetical protein BDP55DRAFT_719417 [Colletotrichum godetiae]|uniref:Uncharacterized protein n=1 Tax=Colletotrichum godetiae TaxID=1209918 RepID=A0AAJ0ENR8_9PEZI|nr:uncharacterized protein BDP55DRAFT_719417 [Colletotrichum godetiae]KAK1660105.1 hypothetical protein BDP55DRAFT_719417 [Colletotrichum godetiae]